jgi:hypothetical protein
VQAHVAVEAVIAVEVVIAVDVVVVDVVSMISPALPLIFTMKITY